MSDAWANDPDRTTRREAFPRATPVVLDQARTLLADGASYREVERTLGLHRSTISHHLPGYGWTPREGGQFRAATRYMR